MSARQKYERRKKYYGKLLQKQKKAEDNISTLRLAVFVVGTAATIFAYRMHNKVIFIASLAIFVALFIYLVTSHGKISARIKYTSLLLTINNRSLQRLDGEWNTFSDTGEDFVEDSHSYSSDLDIFGKNSLFQWINTANTTEGREKLKDLLTGMIGNHTDVWERQGAVVELAEMLNWRQRFCAEGMVATEKMHDPEELIAWGKEVKEFYIKPWVIALFRICPVITVLLVTAGFIMHIIPEYLPATALLIQFGLVSYKVRERYRMFGLFESYSEDIRIYYKMLKHLEKRDFKSALIKGIKADIRSSKGLEAYKQIDRLSSIVDSITYRRNLFYIIFNTLTLWDFQNIIALELWKKQSGHCLEGWFDALGRMEALASLAVIRFEHEEWIMPEICAGTEALLDAKGMGHPLLRQRVHNDLAVDASVKVLLITGSNMSGKSTLLRTAGINLVLAYAGAPVCASAFHASMMEIYTCMRIKDNLEESISSFYAELLRIKRIVKEAESGKRVFFLLDEIFRGTNSQDRHAGARVLINKLSLVNSVGIVSTHDLELCDLEQKNDRIANYHFQEYYENGEIHFDYILRSGPSTTRNAIHLMRLAGIEIDE